MEDIWVERAVPILEAIAAREGQHDFLTVEQLASATCLEPSAVVIEVERLLAGRFVSGELHKPSYGGDVRPWFLAAPYLLERGARVLGRWPSEDPVRLLLSVLQHQLEQETDPDRKSRLRGFAEAAQSVGVDLLAKIMVEFATKLGGIG